MVPTDVGPLQQKTNPSSGASSVEYSDQVFATAYFQCSSSEK